MRKVKEDSLPASLIRRDDAPSYFWSGMKVCIGIVCANMD